MSYKVIPERIGGLQVYIQRNLVSPVYELCFSDGENVVMFQFNKSPDLKEVLKMHKKAKALIRGGLNG